MRRRTRVSGHLFAVRVPAPLGAMIVLPRRMDAGSARLFPRSTTPTGTLSEDCVLRRSHAQGPARGGPTYPSSPPSSRHNSAATYWPCLPSSRRRRLRRSCAAFRFSSDAWRTKRLQVVDESGTEAAAATAVSFKSLEPTVEVTPVMRVDHPFVFMVVDASSKEILFAGTVHDVDDVWTGSSGLQIGSNKISRHNSHRDHGVLRQQTIRPRQREQHSQYSQLLPAFSDPDTDVDKKMRASP